MKRTLQSISLLLAVLLLFSAAPFTMAETDGAAETVGISGTDGQDVIQETEPVPNEAETDGTGEDAPETPLTHELPDVAETGDGTAEQKTETVFAVRFVSDLPFSVSVEGEEAEDDNSFLLAPGEYLYSAYPADETYDPILRKPFTVGDGDLEIVLTFEKRDAQPEPEPEELSGEPGEGTEGELPGELPEATEQEPAEEPETLPYGFAGMPEGYELSAKQRKEKADLSERGVPETLSKMRAGKDYAKDRLIFLADTRDYAETVASAYSAELVSYAYGIAEIRLTTATVEQALEIAADPENGMPAVDPDCVVTVEPAEETRKASYSPSAFSVQEVQTRADWKKTMEQLGDQADPFLTDPGAERYQYMHEAVGTYAAWGVTTGSNRITVALLDSGVAAAHEDIEISDYVNFVSGADDAYDHYGHGTHVAGIVGAKIGNGKGGAGIAPDVRMISVRVLGDSGTGYSSDMIRGIRYIAGWNDGTSSYGSRRADIMNMSLGGYPYSNTARAVIEDAVNQGVTAVVASGNDASNIMTYPASYDIPGLISVAALNKNGKRASFSNYGPKVDIAAPGVDIWSGALPGGGSYDAQSGTSMASPVVAGVCALYMSAAGYTSPASMEKIIKNHAASSSVSGIGAGIVNAAKLFESEKSRPVLEVDGTEVPMNGTVTVPYGSSVVLKEQEGSEYSSQFVYTLNGSTPSVSGGKIKTGRLYEELLTAESASGFTGGSTLKFRAIGVTGLGVAGKVFACTLKIAYTETESVSVTVPKSVYLGKSVRLSASVFPENADPKVRWTVENGDEFPHAYVTSAGVLKTSDKDGTGTIRLKAQSGEAFETAEIGVQKTVLADKIILPRSSKVLHYSDGTEPETYQLTPSVRSKGKRDITSDVSLLYTSGNPKAATVDSEGCVRAVGPGKSIIRIKANDGSGASEIFTVHVRQRVTEISVKGQDRISVGKKAAFKTTVRPSNAYNKKVTWSLDVPEGVTASVSRDGKVTVTAAQDGDTLILRATAADGSGVTGEKEIVVSSQVRTIRFDRTKKTLFTADLPGTEEDERVFQLVPEITGNSSVPLIYTSSDRTVATVDGSGLVTALKKGKAVITCKASDGSGAAAKMEFTVRVPASSLSISNPYSHTLGTGDYISAGCSIRHSFKLGSAYGAPSIQKIRWSAAVSYYDGTQYVTDTSGKYAKVGSTGTLQALSAITGLLDWYSDVKVELTGQTTDGTGLSDTLSYTVIRKPKGLIAETGSVTVYTDGETSVDVVVRTNPDYSGYSTIDSFTVRSADPKIAGAIVRTSTAMTIAGRSYYTVKIRIYGGQRTGKTTITVTSNDGSNCKCTIAVKTVE